MFVIYNIQIDVEKSKCISMCPRGKFATYWDFICCPPELKLIWI